MTTPRASLVVALLALVASAAPTPVDGTNSLIGQPAPPFSLPDSNGVTVLFKAGKGIPKSLFFIPNTDTDASQREVESFSDALRDGTFGSSVDVVGISAGSVAAETSAVENLPFSILSDAGLQVHQAYEANADSRVTVFIDSDGIIRDTFESDDWNAHVQFVQEELNDLGM
ncbi:hypothetical protein EIP91_007073 [Steccherinum ochraceum]|uniref:Thioredoxin domain-containing protein n=1 Tax=Steccherinum ochraceum TaxID=92696 RepID=A0A4R0R775_9APHY|nr:hypothetical protein EIP91_007073 [Steccherinum ochraceum]